MRIRAIKKLVSCVMLALTLQNALAADICVRSGATGTGTGADWTNAKTQIPTTFTRGDTIWVAGGTGYTLAINRGNIAMNSTTPLDIKYPTAAAHGPSTGWSDTFTNSQARFNPVNISASYINFNGVVGGGPGNFTNNLGFEIYSISTSPPNDTLIMLSDKYGGPSDRVNITNVLIAHVEIHSTNTPGIGEGINAVAAGASYRGVVCSNLWIHDMGSDPLKFTDIDGLTLDGCHFARNGSDAGHHNSFMHLNGPCLNVTNRNGWIEDVVGTGGIGLYDNAGTNIHIYNTIFCYSPGGILPSAVSTNWGNGLIYTLNNTNVGIMARRVFVNQCTFVNLPANPMIGLYEEDGSCAASNNLFVSNENGGGSWNFTGVTLDYNAFYAPTTGSGSHQTALAGNPFTSQANQNFTLVANITAANPLGAPYNTDMMGNARSASTPSFGALEFGSGNPLAGTPGGGGGGGSTAAGTVGAGFSSGGASFK